MTRTLSTPVAVLGLVSLLLGLSVVAWVLFNVFFEQQPSYSDDALLPSFGAGPLLVILGWRRLRKALAE